MKNTMHARPARWRTGWLLLISVPVAVAIVIALRQDAQSDQSAPRAPSAQTVLASFDLRPEAAVSLRLPQALREVSGFATTADGRLLAHGDERGIVSELDVRTGNIVKSFSLGNPAVRADFEGIAVAGERVFLITATGQLFETREGANGAAMQYNSVATGFGARCELEGMAYNSGDQTLVIGCKEPKDRAMRGQITLFRWSIARRAPASPDHLSVPTADVLRGIGARRFSPSAVEREPRTGNYLIVAGPQSLIAEITPAGAFVAARALDGGTHRQPEAIAFLGSDALLIGDEGGNRRGTLTRYPRVR
jgi:uncharacterized protein YjiK